MSDKPGEGDKPPVNEARLETTMAPMSVEATAVIVDTLKALETRLVDGQEKLSQQVADANAKLRVDLSKWMETSSNNVQSAIGHSRISTTVSDGLIIEVKTLYEDISSLRTALGTLRARSTEHDHLYNELHNLVLALTERFNDFQNKAEE